MTRLTCAEAQIELQDTPSDAATRLALVAHLEACAVCSAFETGRGVLDARIAAALRQADGVSVHTTVRRRLEAANAPRPRARGGIRWMGWVAVPLALAAAVVAATLPRYTSRQSQPEISAQTYRVVRSNIAFPFAVDPARPDHLLTGAWGRVYESWNGGESWLPLARFPRPYIVRDLLIDRADPARYLVATKHSILISSDGGRRWRLVKDSLPGAMNMFLLQDPRNPSTFFVGPSILWKSVDSGETWQPAGPGFVFAPDGIQALTAAPDGSLYTGIWNGGVARSTDGGQTWQRRSGGLNLKVLDVTAGTGALWAATARGIYSSRDGGLQWRRTTPNDRFPTTSVLTVGGAVLVGGDGALYRSVDGGRRWKLAMDGLPPAPYVYSLTADPANPQRVYASLNSDGIFRSDDGGQTWIAANAGLPLQLAQGSARHVLFLRGGVLWVTTTTGADPGNLTVERDVKVAALSPDEAAAAYLAGRSDGWAVRMLQTGGSQPRTLITGSGDMPRRLLWSPDATHLAAIGRRTVYVAGPSGPVRLWSVAPSDRVLSWTADGRALWVWESSDGRVVERDWRAGQLLATSPGRFATLPSVARDGVHVAQLSSDGIVRVATRPALRWRSVAVGSGCRLRDWSGDSDRLLVRCPDTVKLVSALGQVTTVRVAGTVRWAPGSHSALLVFQRHKLLWWTVKSHRVLVRGADSPTPG